MGNSLVCAEFARNGGDVYVLNANDRSLGYVAIMTTTQYEERYLETQKANDPTRMFDSDAVLDADGTFVTFTPYELNALLDYVQHPTGGLPPSLENRQVVTAFESRHDLESFEPESGLPHAQ